MRQKRKRRSSLQRALLLGLVATFAFAATASANEFERFQHCPYTNAEVFKCIHAVTDGGQVVLGKKAVPIVNPVTVQGGVSIPDEEFVSDFFGATNGVTLSKAPQPVPGGLLGIVPPEGAPLIVKAALKLVLENGFTGVNSTLELARPANEIKISELNLIGEEGVAFELPVKVRLENPFLGSNCYVGSSASPMIWKLTTGATAPPPPTESIHGSSGLIEFKEEGELIKIEGTELVDNAWSAPSASGCGGILAPLVDPIINSQAGLPAAAGTNSAILENTIHVALAESVDFHLE